MIFGALKNLIDFAPTLASISDHGGQKARFDKLGKEISWLILDELRNTQRTIKPYITSPSQVTDFEIMNVTNLPSLI